jgi:glycosyltransferase involved in cell wall biosynthesis
MRVACITCTYPPYAGGIGNVAARHAHMLAEAGHEVAVGTPAFEGAPGRVVVDGITVHRLPVTLRHGNSALVRGVGQLVRNADAAYLHYPFYGGAEGAARAARRAGIPYAVFFHMDVHRAGLAGRFISAHRRLAQPSIMRGARAIMVSSADYATTSSLAALELGTIIESPYTAPSQFTAGTPDPSTLQRLGVDPRRPALLFVGAMDADHAFKGVPELLEAFAELHDHPSRPQLVLAGGGGRRDHYMGVAHRLGSDGVVFPGRVSDADLLALYQHAYATILPSTNSDEAYGVVLAEGMACGSPGIASDLPGVRTVVSEGETGILVPAGNVPALTRAMRDLLNDPPRRERMSKAALRDRATRLSPQHERDVVLAALGLL